MVDDSGRMLRVDQFVFGPRLHEQRLLSRMEKRAVVLNQQSTLVVDFCHTSHGFVSLLVGIMVLGSPAGRWKCPYSLGGRDSLSVHHSGSFCIVHGVVVAD